MSLKPVYAMAALHLPKPTIDRIDKPRWGMFWTGAAKCSGGDCQVDWTTACRLKEEDGVDIIDIEAQNTCLLLKTVDKLLTGHRNPWADWVRYWYTPERRAPPTASWAMFQGLLRTYRGLTGVNLGDGVSTSFWYDNWSTAGALASALPALFSHCTNPSITVAAAISSWALLLPLQDRLSAVAAGELATLGAKLAGLHLGAAPDARHLLWGGERAFRSGAVYKMLKATGCSVPLAAVNWDNFAPVKVRVFFWVLRHGNTRTRSFLHRHGGLSDKHCPYCPRTEEDLAHLFFECPRVATFWGHVCSGAQPPLSLDGLLAPLPLPAGALRNTAALLLLWVTWKSRNRMVFDALDQPLPAMVADVVAHARLWTVRAPRRLSSAPSNPGVCPFCNEVQVGDLRPPLKPQKKFTMARQWHICIAFRRPARNAMHICDCLREPQRGEP
jgi:hypothetical protein